MSYPCQYFIQSPPEFYKSQDDCLEVANFKAVELVNKFKANGYTVIDSQYTCIKEDI